MDSSQKDFNLSRFLSYTGRSRNQILSAYIFFVFITSFLTRLYDIIFPYLIRLICKLIYLTHRWHSNWYFPSRSKRNGCNGNIWIINTILSFQSAHQQIQFIIITRTRFLRDDASPLFREYTWWVSPWCNG